MSASPASRRVLATAWLLSTTCASELARPRAPSRSTRPEDVAKPIQTEEPPHDQRSRARMQSSPMAFHDAMSCAPHPLPLRCVDADGAWGRL
eukprot:5049372-Pleurochrysis_carterae.AAC.2